MYIGPVELAGVGVAIAVFNQASKIAIFPLVSVTTSFVAEEDATRSLSAEAQAMEAVENGFGSDNQKEELIPKNSKPNSTLLLILCIFMEDIKSASLCLPVSLAFLDILC